MPVYMIRAGDDGPVKIGWSARMAIRTRQFQTGHYEKLNILRVIDVGRWAERALHARFSSKHIRGEWFCFDNRMLVEEPDRSSVPPRTFPRKRRTQHIKGNRDKTLVAAAITAGVKGRAIACRFGVTAGTASKWLNRGLPVPDRHKAEFAAMIGVTVDDLLPEPFEAAPTDSQPSQEP